MKNVFASSKIYMVGCLLLIVVTASAWQLKTKKQSHDTTSSTTATTNGDTTYPGKPGSSQDDYGLSGLDENLAHLGDQLKNIDINLQGLDTTISESIRQALAHIDFADLGRQTQQALNSIDWPQLKVNIDNSVREAMEQVKKIDWSEVNRSIHQATDEINSEEFKKQLDGVDLQKTINDAMKNAFDAIDMSSPEMLRGKAFIDNLEKDGLIDKRKGYKIEWTDNGDLIINGKQQPKEITDKYRQYYKKGAYTIERDGDSTESL